MCVGGEIYIREALGFNLKIILRRVMKSVSSRNDALKNIIKIENHLQNDRIIWKMFRI